MAQVPSKGETAPHPTEVLVVDLRSGGQAQATVTAIEADFEPQKMREVLQTLEILKGAGDAD